MAGSQISTSVSIIDSLSGFMALSLTEYNTSAAAAIAAGSKVEIAGAFFQFPADETPTGWTAITTGTTAYIALTASGTAGSQVVNASYTSTAPTWRDDLQGWYASAASSVRIVASVYKAEATSYYPKYVLAQYQSSNHLDKLKIAESIDSDTVSASSSMTIAGYNSVSVIDDATANTILFPVGSFVTLVASTASPIELNASVNPRMINSGGAVGVYYDSTMYPSAGTALTGSWVTRGLVQSNTYLIQRIS